MTAAPRAPRGADLAVAAGCWIVGCGVLLALPLFQALDSESSVQAVAPGSLGWWLCLLTVTAQVVVLAWIRIAPRAALVIVAGLSLPLAWAATRDAFSLTSTAITVAVFVTAVRLRLRGLWPTVAATAGLLVAGQFIHEIVDGRLGIGPALGTGLLQGVGAVGLPLLLAAAIAGRRDARDARHLELEAVEREHDALVKVAVANERTAMARELHDIAAHHLSGIALMAAATDRQIDTDPATAKRSVRQIREQSTAVLDDLRRLVGLMRDGAEAPRSVESLVAVSQLVDQRRAGGAPVELRTLRRVSGQALGEGIGPLAQLALYRIAQESLTNAATHAPGAPTVIEIDDRRDDALTLTVTNEAGRPVPPGQRGYGLVGMRERADLLGARLQHGPSADGGWQVRVEVPRNAAERTGPETSRQEERQT